MEDVVDLQDLLDYCFSYGVIVLAVLGALYGLCELKDRLKVNIHQKPLAEGYHI